MNQNLCRMRVLVIGAGSLGSILAEMLVRGGVTHLTVIDNDLFCVGNLSRHILDLDSIGLSKAHEVAKKLNKMNPHAMVNSIHRRFDVSFSERLSEYDVIFDCTGNDDVLKSLSEVKTSQWLCSVSFGFEVNYIYIFVGMLESYSFEAYLRKFNEVNSKEIAEFGVEKIPWEGIGCWSPVFPATYGDVSLAASVAVSVFNQRMIKGGQASECIFFRKQFDTNAIFNGVIQIDD